MSDSTLIARFALAMVIGILVGLQREVSRSESERELFAGARTYALLGVVGCAAALFGQLWVSPWPFLIVFAAVSGLIGVAYYVSATRGDVGLTSEIAAVIVFLVGGLCYWGRLELAAALGVGTAVLLSLKLEVRRLVGRVTREDIVATLKFAVITAIVLPLLPNRTFGAPPFDVLNPQHLWLMVVFISGIGFVGYLLMKLVGSRRGIGLTGFLGGLVSSTAVTLSFTHRSRGRDDLARPFALAIIAAWTMMFARVLIEVSVIDPRLLSLLWTPLAASAGLGLGYVALLALRRREKVGGEVALKAPFELAPAIRFGIVYAVILVVSRAAQTFLGEPGVYLSAAASGVADVDAITLSLSELSQAGDLSVSAAARGILVAAMTNTAVKGGIVVVLAGASLRRAILPGLVVMLAAGALLAFLL